MIKSFNLNRFETEAITLPNGTFFKLVSDKIVTVVIKGGAFANRIVADTYCSSISTYYPSTDGSYVGKEFIFPITYDGSLGFIPYRVFSIEAAKVEIYEGGSLIKSVELPANSVAVFQPTNGPYAM